MSVTIRNKRPRQPTSLSALDLGEFFWHNGDLHILVDVHSIASRRQTVLRINSFSPESFRVDSTEKVEPVDVEIIIK